MISWIAKYFGTELVKRIFQEIMDWLKREIDLWKIRKEQKRKLKNMVEANSENEIRRANRSDSF